MKQFIVFLFVATYVLAVAYAYPADSEDHSTDVEFPVVHGERVRRSPQYGYNSYGGYGRGIGGYGGYGGGRGGYGGYGGNYGRGGYGGYGGGHGGYGGYGGYGGRGGYYG